MKEKLPEIEPLALPGVYLAEKIIIENRNEPPEQLIKRLCRRKDIALYCSSWEHNLKEHSYLLGLHIIISGFQKIIETFSDP